MTVVFRLFFIVEFSYQNVCTVVINKMNVCMQIYAIKMLKLQ